MTPFPTSRLASVLPRREDAGRLLLVAAAYLFLIQLSRLVPAAGGVMNAIWPPAGLVLAALLVSPSRLWPAILAVTALENMAVELIGGRKFLTELGYVLANIIAAGGSAWFIVRSSSQPVTLRRLNEVLALGAAAVVMSALAAVFGAAASLVEGAPSYLKVFRNWWVADTLGLLLVAPPLVAWFGPGLVEPRPRRWCDACEAALIAALGGWLFWAYYGPQREHLPLRTSSYMVFIPLLWAALRQGTLGLTLLLSGFGLAQVGLVALGLTAGSLGGDSVEERLILVQLFVATQCLVTLVVAASLRERRLAEDSLRASEARLRSLGDNLPGSMIYQVVRERDGRMRFLHVSGGVERLNGLLPGQVLGDPSLLYGQLIEADRAAVVAAEEDSLHTMSVFDVVARMRRADGQTRWMHIRSQPRRLPDGRIAWDGIETDITEFRQMEDSLRASEEKFSKAFRASPVAIIVSGLDDGRILDANAALERLTGYRREEMLGRTTVELNLWPDVADREKLLAELRAAGRLENRDLRFRNREGGEIAVQMSAETIEVGGKSCLLCAMSDITSRLAAKEELRRVNRALRTISNCNQILVRAGDEGELLREICNVIVRDSGHRLAWVGYAEPDEAKTVRLMAAAGEQAGYLETLAVSWADTERGQGPTGLAIRTGKPVASHDFLNDPRLAHWHEAGRQSGFRSSVALPLQANGAAFGALSIYSGDVHAFDEAEIKLLAELADDLAFGLQALRERGHKQDAERQVRTLLAEAETSRAALLSILEDQRRGEEALRASEEQFRSALQHSPIGMAIVSTAGRWLSVNQALCQLVGYSQEEMQARDFQAITHPDDVQRDTTVLHQLLDRRMESYSVEKRYRHRAGHYVWVQLNVSLLRRPDGTPRHFIAQIQDISERKRAEQERARLMRDLGERVKELTALHRAARLLQQERPFDLALLQELVALLPAAWQHPEVCVAQIRLGDLTTSTPGWQESPWIQDIGFRTRTGQTGAIRVAYLVERPVAVEGPFLAEERVLLQSLADMLTAHLDRLAAENALRSVNRRYARHEAALSALSRSYARTPEDLTAVLREIVEMVARTLEVGRVSVWTYNRTRTAIVCLDLFEAALQRHGQGGELPRTGHEAYFSAVDSAEIIAAVDASADPRTFALAADYLRPLNIISLLDAPLHARGVSTGVLCCEHLATVRAWTPDEQTFVVAVANLVSMLFAQLEQQQLESQLRHTQKLEALGTLAGGIAHDFNNILGAIISFTELARMDHPRDAELQENLGEVLKASNRAVGLVRQILAFSRRQQQERKAIALVPVVREVLQLMRSTLPVTIEIHADLPDHLPPLLADSTQIHQVLMNLCTNAGHAMRGQKGRLTVSVERANEMPEPLRSQSPGGFLCLTVSDTGHGMNAATLARIFDPFFTTKGPGEGTGLGLAVVHGIIQEHGGDIAVESEPGKGTTFRVLLPVADTQVLFQLPESGGAPVGQGQRVLFVDDEVALAEGARRLLGRQGFQVVAVSRPEEALALFERAPDSFCSVLTDLTMPTMTGVELAQRLLRLRPGLTVFIMTGHAGELTVEAARAQGIADLILKPLDYLALARKLAESCVAPRPTLPPTS